MTQQALIDRLRKVEEKFAIRRRVRKQHAPSAPVQAVPDGWQPIETAPKDGTKILLFFNKRFCRGMRNDEVTIGFWHQPGNPAHKGFWTGWGSGRAHATHWMPLPAAPQPDKENE